MISQRTHLKVGEMSKRAGVSVRTLHHYDAIGLLRPSVRTPSGHRLYTARDLERLDLVAALRRAGFGLEEIRDCLARPVACREVVLGHLETARAELRLKERRVRWLETVAEHLSTTEGSTTKDLFGVLEYVQLLERYFTPEQRAFIARRFDELGSERAREWSAAGRELVEELRRAKERRARPEDAEVQELVARRRRHARELSGADAELEEAMGRLYHAEPRFRERRGVDAELYEFLNRAEAVARADG